VNRRDYPKRIINPCLHFKQSVLEMCHCGRTTRNAVKFTGSHESIKLKLCCLSILEGAEWGQRQTLQQHGSFWPELFTAEAYGGFAPILQPPNPPSSQAVISYPSMTSTSLTNLHPTPVSQLDITGATDRLPSFMRPVLP